MKSKKVPSSGMLLPLPNQRCKTTGFFTVPPALFSVSEEVEVEGERERERQRERKSERESDRERERQRERQRETDGHQVLLAPLRNRRV